MKGNMFWDAGGIIDHKLELLIDIGVVKIVWQLKDLAWTTTMPSEGFRVDLGDNLSHEYWSDYPGKRLQAMCIIDDLDSGGLVRVLPRRISSEQKVKWAGIRECRW